MTVTGDERTERIVISLRRPMRFDVVIRLMKAIAAEFPEARWVPSDDEGNLVIEVEADFPEEIYE